MFYLAVAPQLFGSICQRLDEIGIVDEHARVILEKPIGHDLALGPRGQRRRRPGLRRERRSSASTTTSARRRVQNLARRCASPTRSSSRSGTRRCIDHVQITVAETVGVERPRRLLRRRGRAARHGAEPPAAAALPGGDGAAVVRRTRDRCATRRSRCSRRCGRSTRTTSTTTPCAASTTPGSSTATRCRLRRRRGQRRASATETFVALKAEVAQLALGGRAVLPAHRQAHADARVRDRGPSSRSRRTRSSRRPTGGTDAEPAASSWHPARRGRAPAPDRQGAGPGRQPPPADVPLDLTLRHGVRRAAARRLRAAADGRHQAATRRCSCAATRSRPRGHGPSRSCGAGRRRPSAPKRYPAGTTGPTAAAMLLERDGRTWQEPDQ